jgi:Cu(I)/Ag(I) efflux system protein CusF
MKRIALTLALSTFAALAVAQPAQVAQSAPPAAPAAKAAAKELADGEVRKVDKAAGKVIIKHGEIKSVNMGPMTMAFTVKSPALLDNVAVGDKVKFSVEQKGGDYVVTALEKAK